MISSCNEGESFDRNILQQLAAHGACKYKFVLSPEEADIVLVIDIDEPEHFANLRKNEVWKIWPDKCFAICERDHPPFFLRGLLSSAKKTWFFQSRYLGCGYIFHQFYFPNKIPRNLVDNKLEKKYLFSFIGRPTGNVRHKILDISFKDDVIIEDVSKRYNHFDLDNRINGDVARARYWEVAKESKFALCPSGFGPSSIRIFEMMEAGVAPIIISDDWVAPWGPNWDDFAIFVPEKDVYNIYNIISSREGEYVERGILARKAWEEYFSEEKYFNFILDSIQEIQGRKIISERYFVRLANLILFLVKIFDCYKKIIRYFKCSARKFTRLFLN